MITTVKPREKVQKLLELREMKVGSLAGKINHDRQKIGKWIKGTAKPRYDSDWEPIANFFGIPLEDFLDPSQGLPPTYATQPRSPNVIIREGLADPGSWSRVPADGGRTPTPGVAKRLFPLVGSAGAAAIPLESSEHEGDWVEFSEELFGFDRFAIRVRGDSMEPDIQHGDYILVQPSAEVHPGLFAVVENDNHEYVVKLMTYQDRKPLLKSMNPEYAPIVPGDGWKIVGFAVGRRQERGKGRYLEEGDDAGLRPRS